MNDKAITGDYTGSDIVNNLIQHARLSPDKKAFVVLTDGEDEKCEVSYAELESIIAWVTAQLEKKGLKGERVLLLYNDALDFIVSFLACQYLDIIAVPVAYGKGEKHIEKVASIINDAKAAAVFCSDDRSLSKELAGLDQYVPIEILRVKSERPVQTLQLNLKPACNKIAFIQYTSGSTGVPKGVVITNDNLLHNEHLIKNAFGCNSDSVIFTWLPFHHDMGLIGNLLHTIYVGCTCIVMSPLHFIQRPQRWLEGISKYKATHSGGPNFAYDLCVSRISPEEMSALNLSSWLVAFNGSEQVRLETLNNFAGYFKPAGFCTQSFFPCYGLAEATLLVSSYSGAQPNVIYIEEHPANREMILLSDDTNVNAKPIVTAGSIEPGMEVKIVSTRTHKECGELQKGEICIAGKSVTKGYWNKDDRDVFYEFDRLQFLRTGDLGFIYNNELFVHGRLKEMLIIRGKNFYPNDIEQVICKSHNAIETNGVAVFGMNEYSDEFVVGVEIKRGLVTAINAEDIVRSVDNSVIASFGIIPYDIILTTPRGIPRTTSGKLQRVKCKDYYSQGTFNIIASKSVLLKNRVRETKDDRLLKEVLRNANQYSIKTYLLNVIACKVDGADITENDQNELTGMGVDSIRAMEILNTINKDLQINLDVSTVLRNNTLSGLVNIVENILWIKTKQSTGEEIII